MAETDSSAKGGIRNQFIAVIVTNILTFNQGCAIGWVSPSLPALTDVENSPMGAPLTVFQLSLVASTFCIGAIFGTPVFGWLADRFGRKKASMASALPFMIGWTLKLVWLNPTALICARLIIGFGGAGTLLIAPLYSSEVASVEARGILGSLLTFTFNTGVVVVFALGAYFSYFVVLTIMLTVPFLFFILMSRMPESPSYLVKTNQLKEAGEALAWLRSVPVDSDLVKKEVNKLVYEAETSAEGNSAKKCGEDVSPWRFLLNSPPSMKALALTVSLLTAQCFIGIFAVVTYANNIFEEAGSTLSPSMASIVIGFLQLAGSVVASSLIERLGRKILLISSCCTVILSMATLGTYFYVRDTGYDVSALGWIPVTSLSIAVSTFSMGIGPVPFILPSEVFLVQVRGLATSIGLTWLWICTFFVSQFFAPIVILFGSHVVFWGFSFVGCIAIFIAVMFLPETKGRPIEEIVAHFGGKKYTNSQGVSAEEAGQLFLKPKLVINDGMDERDHD